MTTLKMHNVWTSVTNYLLQTTCMRLNFHNLFVNFTTDALTLLLRKCMLIVLQHIHDMQTVKKYTVNVSVAVMSVEIKNNQVHIVISWILCKCLCECVFYK